MPWQSFQSGASHDQSLGTKSKKSSDKNEVAGSQTSETKFTKVLQGPILAPVAEEWQGRILSSSFKLTCLYSSQQQAQLMRRTGKNQEGHHQGEQVGGQGTPLVPGKDCYWAPKTSVSTQKADWWLSRPERSNLLIAKRYKVSSWDDKKVLNRLWWWPHNSGNILKPLNCTLGVSVIAYALYFNKTGEEKATNLSYRCDCKCLAWQGGVKKDQNLPPPQPYSFYKRVIRLCPEYHVILYNSRTLWKRLSREGLGRWGERKEKRRKKSQEGRSPVGETGKEERNKMCKVTKSTARVNPASLIMETFKSLEVPKMERGVPRWGGCGEGKTKATYSWLHMLGGNKSICL